MYIRLDGSHETGCTDLACQQRSKSLSALVRWWRREAVAATKLMLRQELLTKDGVRRESEARCELKPSGMPRA